MLISGGLNPCAPHFQGSDWIEPYCAFDAWTLAGGCNLPEVDRAELLRFSRLADHHGKIIRGGQLFPAIARRYQTWEDRLRRAKILANCVPAATSWDVIHEPYPDLHQRPRWGSDWMRRALDTAHALAPQADLFISEYRPQDQRRLDWLVGLVSGLLDSGTPVHGLSVQLHSNLVSLQAHHLARIAETLLPLRTRIKIHCVEVVAWDLISDHFRRPPPLLAEQLQAHRYAEYRAFATVIGAELFGPWFPWDGHYTHWRSLPDGMASPGLYRRDWSPKPACEAVFKPVLFNTCKHLPI
jgi:hypothetical protein